MPNPTEILVTKMHLAIENELIEMRDSRMSIIGPANGLVVNERDGSPSSIMRMGTRAAMEIALGTLLASPWLAARDAEMKAVALEEAAAYLPYRFRPPANQHDGSAWLLDCAAEYRRTATPEGDTHE